jgi:hypothetical protein
VSGEPLEVDEPTGLSAGEIEGVIEAAARLTLFDVRAQRRRSEALTVINYQLMERRMAIDGKLVNQKLRLNEGVHSWERTSSLR